MVDMATGFKMPGGAPVSTDFPFLKSPAMPACSDGRVIKNASFTSFLSCMNWVGAGAGAAAFMAAVIAAVIAASRLSPVLAFAKNSVVAWRDSDSRFVALFKKACIFPLVTGPSLGSLVIFCFSAPHLRATVAASSFVATPKKSNSSLNE